MRSILTVRHRDMSKKKFKLINSNYLAIKINKFKKPKLFKKVRDQCHLIANYAMFVFIVKNHF